MPTDEFDQILAHTLNDHKLSRGEKRVLQKTIQELVGRDERRLALVRSRAFAIARDELIGPDAIGVLDWLEDVIKVMNTPADEAELKSEAYFSPHGDCQGKISSMLFHARESIDICVFTITDDRITQAIKEAHLRDVKIRILTDNDKAFDIGSDIDRLKSLGIKVRTDRTSDHMHHKYAIFDQKWLLTGSYNWTRSASTSNEENFIVTNDAKLLRAFQEDFQRLWDELG